MDISSKLIKKDIEASLGIEIATYRIRHIDGHVTHWVYKNEKWIGLAEDETLALQLHEMYARVHIFQNDCLDSSSLALIKEMRSIPQDNSFLHDLDDAELRERRKMV